MSYKRIKGALLLKFMTVERAKREIARLQKYVFLVDTYEVDTLDKFVIRTYAEVGSLESTLDLAHRAGYGYHLEKEDLVAIIKKIKKDELHKLIRAGYMHRTRASRKKAPY